MDFLARVLVGVSAAWIPTEKPRVQASCNIARTSLVAGPTVRPRANTCDSIHRFQQAAAFLESTDSKRGTRNKFDEF
jgi:hypothetical protein